MNEKEPKKITLRTKLAFASGEIGDNTAFNIFQFLVFTFYFTLVKLPVTLMTLGFIIWCCWNAFNDPLIGYLSDRTKTKWGRRMPWLIGATIPLAIMTILLFAPPLNLGSQTTNFVYFFIVLILWDLVYTSMNLNYNAVFSEQFVEMRDRSSTGRIRIIFVMIGLIFAFTFPSFIITDITNIYDSPETLGQYQLVGILAAIVIILFYFILLKWGVREPKFISKDAETAMPFLKTVKTTFKHKSFLWFLLPTIGTWLVLNIMPTLAPLFYVHALHIYDAGLIGLLLLLNFIVAGASTPLWERIRVKKGARMSGLVGIIVWLFATLGLAYSINFEMAVIMNIFWGIGLGGGLYFYDQCIAEIIDEDEITQGTRRSGIYYAVLNFFIRFAAILNFVMIGVVFTSSDWMNYTPNPGVDVIAGLRLLMGVYPAIVLVISLIGLYIFPIKGERLKENRRKLTELHEKKQSSFK